MEMVTHITQTYHSATQGWYHYLFPIANKLFTTLAIIELAWAGIWWAIEKNEITSLFAEFLKKIIILGIFYTILLYANQWIPSIIKSFMMIGAGSTKISHLYPGDVFDQGISIAANMISTLGYAAFIYNPFAAVSVFISAYVVVVGYALIAAQIVIAQIEAYIIVGAGALLLGFSGSQITRSISLNYFNYAINLGLRLFFLFMIIGVGSQITLSWAKISNTNFIEAPTACLEIIGGVLIFVYVVWVIPQKVQGLMTGIPEQRVRHMSTLLSAGTQVFQQTKTMLNRMLAKDTTPVREASEVSIQKNAHPKFTPNQPYKVDATSISNATANASKLAQSSKTINLSKSRIKFNENK